MTAWMYLGIALVVLLALVLSKRTTP